MNVSKDAVRKFVASSNSKVTGVRFSPDELLADKKSSIKDITKDLETRLRNNKDFTVAIIG
jgi:hypothetical protein